MNLPGVRDGDQVSTRKRSSKLSVLDDGLLVLGAVVGALILLKVFGAIVATVWFLVKIAAVAALVYVVLRMVFRSRAR
ncbi:MAG TPA: hypothetical protein VF230_17560 [Acidimicrobiales bacterium]